MSSASVAGKGDRTPGRPLGGDQHGEYHASLCQRQRSSRDSARRAEIPGRRGHHPAGRRDPGTLPADPRAGHRDEHRRPCLPPGRVHLRAGLHRRRRLQPPGLADPQDPRHKGHRGRLRRLGTPRRRASPGRGRAGRRGDVGVVRPDDLRLDRKAPAGLPSGCRCDLAHGGEGGRGLAGPGRAGRGDLRPVSPGGPGPGPGRGVRGPVRQAGNYLRRRGSPVGGPDARVRGGGAGGAGRAVRPGRRGRHPDLRPAVPRRPAGGHAPAGGRRAAARAGRAAGQSGGAHLAGRPDGPGRQLRAAGRVDGAGPRAVGRAPRRRISERQRRGRLARRRRRPRDGVRRDNGPCRDRRRQPRRP